MDLFKNLKLRFLIVAALLIPLTVYAARKISSGQILLGEGKIGQDHRIISNQPGAIKPYHGYNYLTQKWVISNDGVSERAIGSGSGSGGGENFNNAFTDDDNASAEEGIDSWVSTSGTFSVDESDPLEGTASFLWTPTALGGSITSGLINMNRDVLSGRACQLSLEYIGGDENLTLKVLDAADNVFKEQVLKSHSLAGVESLFFICPTKDEIIADPNLASFKVSISNDGATLSSQIKFDKVYMGTLIGLSEVTLPDTISASYSGAVSGRLGGDDDVQCVRDSVGTFTCTWPADFNQEIANVQLTNGATALGQGSEISVTANNGNSITFITTASNGGLADRFFNILIKRQGTDSKQSIQVYKSIPTISQNINSFAIRFLASGVKDKDDFGIIDGNCIPSGNSLENKTCSFVSGVFNNPPIVVPGPCGNNDDSVAGYSTTKDGFVYTTIANGSTLVDRPACFIITKTGTDFKLPTVQPILVNQVVSSQTQPITVDRCTTAATTGAPLDSSCNTWVSNSQFNGTGNLELDLIKPYKSKPVCVPVVTQSTATNPGSLVYYDYVNSTASKVVFRNAGTSGGNFNQPNAIICIGEK